MSAYMKVAEQILIDRVVSKKFPITRKSKANLGLLALSGLFGLTGAGFLIYASYLWFGTIFQPEMAAAFTGLCLLGLSAISTIVTMLIVKQKRKEVEKSTKETIQHIQGFIDAANDEFGAPIQENPKTAVALATVLGVAMGNKLF
jgi:hypothetical protein